jgi:hypothetical protein
MEKLQKVPDENWKLLFAGKGFYRFFPSSYKRESSAETAQSD